MTNNTKSGTKVILSLENAVIPQHFDLHFELDPTKANFKGSAKISLKLHNSKSFHDFCLHSKDLVITTAVILDKKLTIKYDSENQLTKFHSEELIESVNDDLQLELEYIGKINAIKTHQDQTTGVFRTKFMNQSSGGSSNYVIATHCQPNFARTIFPCIDELSTKATYEVSISTLKRFTVISNTTESTTPSLRKVENSNFKIVKFNKTPLMTTSVFGFVVGDLDSLKTEVSVPISNKKINIGVYATTNITDVTFTLDTIQKYLPILETYFNKGYALDKLDFVLLPFLSDMAMENFGLVTILMNHLLLPPQALANIAVREQSQQLIVHELVHQWMGNYVTYDSWEYLWFNESFATWLAYHLLESNGDLENYWTSPEYLQVQLESTLENDMNINTLSILASSKKAGNSHIINNTSDVFDTHAYTKGITMLRSLQLTIGDKFLQIALQKVLNDNKFHERSIKPMDIWTEVAKELKSENISNFVSSWTRLPGFPILHVTMEKNADDIFTKIRQNRFYQGNQDDIEDVPYHAPLFILKRDGELDKENVLMTDRTLELKYPIGILNHDYQGYYKVSYENNLSYDMICETIKADKLNELDLYAVLNDLSLFIGDSKYQKIEHLEGFLQIMETLSGMKVTEKYWYGIFIGLELLQTIEQSIMRNGTNNEKYDYMSKIIKPFNEQVDWPTEKPFFDEFSNKKLKVMSQLLFFSKIDKEMNEKNEIYFKLILQGPKEVIPLELVANIFACYSYNMHTVTRWKKLFELLKSSDGVVSHVRSGTSKSIQSAAMENIGFTVELELINKILNYITSNIDVAGVELMLFGMSFNGKAETVSSGKSAVKVKSESVWEVVWSWFTKKYDQWSRKSQKSEKVANTLLTITTIVLQMGSYQAGNQNVTQFITKMDKIAGHTALSDTWESVFHENKSKQLIYRDLELL